MGLTPINGVTAGAAYLAFAPDGKILYMGARDGSYVWDLKHNAPEPLHGSGTINCISATNTSWFAAFADGSVWRYPAGSVIPEEKIFTSAGGIEVNGVAVQPNGMRLAIAAGDNTTHLLGLPNNEPTGVIEGHERGVRRVSWHPFQSRLISSGADSCAKLWDLDRPEGQQLVKQLAITLPRIDDPEALRTYGDCSAVWHPVHGNYGFIVSATGDILKFSTEETDEPFNVTPNQSGPVSAIAISPNGQYLAVAYPKAIVICRTATGDQIVQSTTDIMGTIVQVVFSPTDNCVVWADVDGNFGVWSNPIPSAHAHPAKTSIVRPQNKATVDKSLVSLFEDGGDGDDAGQFESIDADLEGGLADDAEDHDGDDGEEDDRQFGREMVNVTRAQPPFQPGATEMTNKKRYLAHNTIGFVEGIDVGEHQVVNVEFYDSSTRAGYSFEDSDQIAFASIGERGIVYASNPIKDEKGRELQPSKLQYRPYSNWGAEKDWSMELPSGERIVAVAAGGTPPRKSFRQASGIQIDGAGCAIVATRNGFVYFLSGSGLQRYIFTLGGTVVSMVAGHEWVFIVHRDGGTSLDGCQNLRFSVVALDTFDLVQSGPLPLPKSLTLKWIGITAEGAPAMYDSAGLLSILDRFRRPTQGRWVPLLDTKRLERRKDKEESYWPVGLSNDKFMCLILKGRQEYPTFPWPLIQELPIAMPLWPTPDTKANTLEERLLRGQIHVTFLADSYGDEEADGTLTQKEIELDKEILQLINSAAAGGLLQRALDLAGMLHHPASINAATQIAGRHKLAGLQEQLEALKSERSLEERYQTQREERQNWGRHTDPIGARKTGGCRDEPQSLDFAPVSAPRRALAPAVPLARNTNAFDQPKARDSNRWNRMAPPTAGPAANDYSLNDDVLMDQTPSPGDKRKRIDDDDEGEDEPAVRAPEERNVKRRTTDEPAPKTSANPFAKKNPGPKSTALQKSGSFFNKVEVPPPPRAVEAKPKGSGLKPQKTQTTLFGIPPPPPAEKKSKKSKNGGRSAEAETESEQASAAAGTATEETWETVDDEETQLVTEAEPEPSAEGKRTEEAMQLDEDEDAEPIDWPASPPRSTQTIGNDAVVV